MITLDAVLSYQHPGKDCRCLGNVYPEIHEEVGSRDVSLHCDKLTNINHMFADRER